MGEWLSFVAAFGVALVLMYIPGLSILKAGRLSLPWALSAAPLISCALIFITGETFAWLRIPLNITLYIFILLCITVAARVWQLQAARPGALLTAPQTRTHAAAQPATHTFGCAPISTATLALYLGIGVVCTLIWYVVPLWQPSNLANGWDIVAHLNYAQTFIQNSTYSSLHASYYSTAAAQLNPSSAPATFYPCGWNILCALIAQIANASIPIAANALNSVFLAVCWPLSCMTFVANVFPTQPHARTCAAFVCCLSTIFPWTLLIYGPLFPFLSACCLMPSIYWIFMQLTRSAISPRERIQLGCYFVLGGITLMLLHTSALFSSIVILTPWCASRIAHTSRTITLRSKPISRLVLSAVFVIAVCAVWAACYLIIVLKQGLLNFWWPSITTIHQALLQGLLFEFVSSNPWGNWFISPQPVFSVLYILGAIRAFRLKQGRSLVVAFVYLLSLGIVLIAFDTPLKSVLASFWYTDPYRIASLAIICAMPILGLGLHVALECMCCAYIALITRVRRAFYTRTRCVGSPSSRTGSHRLTVVKAATLILILGIHATVTFPQTGTWKLTGTFDHNEHSEYKIALSAPVNNLKVVCAGVHDDRFINRAKINFLQRAHAIVGNDVVLNNPYDGSVLAYGYMGMNTLWRYPKTLQEYERPGFAQLRLEAYAAADRYKVQDIIRRTHAAYLLSLGEHVRTDTSLAGDYIPQTFSGITRVTAETPGFTLVLEDGDMKLFRIDESAWSTEDTSAADTSTADCASNCDAIL